tara:strand:+ start:30515 stop:31330 length:816 start_codon:yes stop_codon:yes gene_type:complete
MIEVKNGSVHIGKKPILLGVAFNALPGAITAIIGPNGSGKTTLLKAISGDLPYGGSIRVHGREINALKPWEMAAMRAVLPQSSSLSFPFTIREVVRLGLTAGRTGASRGQMDDIVEEALARVDLQGFSGRFYQELSGGEQQRVQLARVLCQVWHPVVDEMPRYLFLDEPISSLDIRHQLVILDIARDFAQRGGGVLAILHDLNLTAMYADNILVMHQGQVRDFGPPNAVLKNDLLQSVFECNLRVSSVPAGNNAFVLPQSVTADKILSPNV